MIKTTSFAPPRARNPRASGRKVAALRATNTLAPARALAPATQTATEKMPRQSSKKTASPSETAQFSLFGEEESEIPAPVAEKVAAKAPKTVIEPAEIEAKIPEIEGKARKTETKSATIKAKAPIIEQKAPKIEAKTPKIEAKTPKVEAETDKSEAKTPKIEAEAPKKAKSTTPRVKRVKIPDNLGAQYGESLSKRAENGEIPVLEPETPKKRLTKVARQARRDLMRPDDVMARLKRLNDLPVRKAPVEKREKGWKFECGRCAKVSYFQTPGGICDCGALAIKE